MKKGTLLAITITWVAAFVMPIQAQQIYDDLSSDKTTLKNPGDSLTNDLNNYLQQGEINGFSVAIVNQNKILYQKGFGYANVERKEAYTHKTIQSIASISKTLIGIALLKAQEQGKLKLDDPINMYLPFKVFNPYYPDLPITIRHLATHSSSIKNTNIYVSKAYLLQNKSDLNRPVLKKFDEKFNAPISQSEMGSFLKSILAENEAWYRKRHYSKNKPGEKYLYSNLGAALAAYIIEQATGESYDEYTMKHILTPLGMVSSGWSFNKVEMENHSMLYRAEVPLPKYSLITYPDGGLITNANDLGKFLIELISGYSGKGTLLKPTSYKELFKEQLMPMQLSPHRDKWEFNDEYNTGIFMGFTPNGLIGHTGGDPGVSTYMFFNPHSKIGKIVIFNTSDVSEKLRTIWDSLDKYERAVIR